MKKFLIVFAVLLLLCGCTPAENPNRPSSPAVTNEGGFHYDAVTYTNGDSTVEFPEFYGLEGAVDMTGINYLIYGDAVAIFKDMSEEFDYTGTFLECSVRGDILTVEFYGTYENGGVPYTSRFFANYNIRETRRVSVTELVDKDAVLAALMAEQFTMPENELYPAEWNAQADYIKQNAAEIANKIAPLENDSDPNAAIIPPVSAYVTENGTVLCVAVSHQLYDFAEVVLFGK